MIRVNEKLFLEKAKICSNSWRKFKGLMFSKKLTMDEGILFEFDSELKVSLHTWFVFYPIDIIFIDKYWKVVDIKRNVKPFSPLIRSKNKFKYFIEVAGNKAKDVKIGDNISKTFK